MDFWTAYAEARKLAPRAEEFAVGLEVSVHTIKAWDRRAEKGEDDHHTRNPSHFNRVRLARFAETKGAKPKIVAALKPEIASTEARP